MVSMVCHRLTLSPQTRRYACNRILDPTKLELWEGRTVLLELKTCFKVSLEIFKIHKSVSLQSDSAYILVCLHTCVSVCDGPKKDLPEVDYS
jgi:hypothetical protein